MVRVESGEVRFQGIPVYLCRGQRFALAAVAQIGKRLDHCLSIPADSDPPASFAVRLDAGDAAQGVLVVGSEHGFVEPGLYASLRPVEGASGKALFQNPEP